MGIWKKEESDYNNIPQMEPWDEKYLSFRGKKYAFNLEALKRVCLTPSSEHSGREIEITNVYEPTPDGDYVISSKVEHETKVNKTPQNDMIVYDFVKMFILTLLEVNSNEMEYQDTLSTVLAINTLISWGILEEKNE
jgi:hypothetical protein